jgi:murein hydrolase activator
MLAISGQELQLPRYRLDLMVMDPAMKSKRSQGTRSGLGVAALVASIAAPAYSLADPTAPAPPAAAASAPSVTDEQQKSEKQTELHGVEDTLRASEDQRRAIESEIASIRLDRARLTAALIETTGKVQDSERSVAAAGERLTSLAANAESLSHSLDSRRDAMMEVLAALQRMGTNPPPAILIKPQSMAEAVRAASLLAATVPELKAQVEALARDIDDLSRTREAIARERDVETQNRTSLELQKARLSALVDARQKSLSSAEDALGSQQKRAAELVRQATSLKDLLARLDAEENRRREASNAAEAADAAAAREIAMKAQDAPSGDSVRLKPDLAFADIKGRVPLPVAGAILKTFGAIDRLGGVEHGVSIATLADAVVSAPADGSVVFSGPYRTYGELLIINAGGGYYVLLAGMDRINVLPGEFVLTGEPVGAMGGGAETRKATAAAVGAAQPVLYIELRKDGTAIDPGPWWAKSDIEKARG